MTVAYSSTNVSAVPIPAGQAVQIVPPDSNRTDLRFNNSLMCDLCFSVSQAAAQTFKGWRNTGQQADFELHAEEDGNLVQSAIWCFNNSTVAASVAVIQGYRS